LGRAQGASYSAIGYASPLRAGYLGPLYIVRFVTLEAAPRARRNERHNRCAARLYDRHPHPRWPPGGYYTNGHDRVHGRTARRTCFHGVDRPSMEWGSRPKHQRVGTSAPWRTGTPIRFASRSIRILLALGRRAVTTLSTKTSVDQVVHPRGSGGDGRHSGSSLVRIAATSA